MQQWRKRKMSKTINFPEFMANEIINEDDIYPKIAFRLDEAYLNYYKKIIMTLN